MLVTEPEGDMSEMNMSCVVAPWKLNHTVTPVSHSSSSSVTLLGSTAAIQRMCKCNERNRICAARHEVAYAGCLIQQHVRDRRFRCQPAQDAKHMCAQGRYGLGFSTASVMQNDDADKTSALMLQDTNETKHERQSHLDHLPAHKRRRRVNGLHNPPDVHLPRIPCWIFASLNLRLSILLRHQAHFEARTLNAAAGHVMLAAVRTRQRAEERDTFNRERAWQGAAEVSAAHLGLICCCRGAAKLLVLRQCLCSSSLRTMDVVGDKERACDEADGAQVRSRVIGYEAGHTWRRVFVTRG